MRDGERRRVRRFAKRVSYWMLVWLVWATSAKAQVAIHPATTRPADWDRFAIRVFNTTDDSIVTVTVQVPEAIAVLGVDGPPGWTFQLRAASDTSSQSIDWAGGHVARGEFREFALLGRLRGDAKRGTLVFPVRVGRASGNMEEWIGAAGSPHAAPRVTIVGRTVLSARGAAALASVAIAIGLVALALALAPRRTDRTDSR